MGYYESMFILIPAIILSGYASMKVKSTFAKYSNKNNSVGLTGACV